MPIKLAPNAFDFPEGSAPATPDSGYVRLYAKTDNKLYIKDDGGTETELGGGTGTDPDAIHVSIADEYGAADAKATPVAADRLLIEDSEDSFEKKVIEIGDLPFADGTHASTHEAGGSDAIDGDALEADTTVANYTPTSSTIGGHLEGIDTALGSVGGGAPYDDTTAIVKGSADNTKQIRFEVDGLTTGTTRVLTPPDFDISLVGGPASTSNNVVPRYDGTTGKLLKASGVSISDAGVVAAGGLTVTQAIALQYIASGGASVNAGLVYDGSSWTPRKNTFTSVNPSVTDDFSSGYFIGSLWINATNDTLFVCIDNSNGAAKWTLVNGSSGGATVVSANKVHLFGAAVTTTSTSMVDVDATNAAITATLTGGGKALVQFSFGANKATSGSAFFRITDGTNHSTEVEFTVNMALSERTVRWIFDTTAGSTTYKLQFRSSNAATANFRGDISAMHATVLEIT